MQTILIDGPFDGTVVTLERPLVDALAIMQAVDDPSITKTYYYYPWNESFSIYAGLFNNIKRLIVEQMVPYTGNGTVQKFDEGIFFSEAEKKLREKSKKAKLLNYRVKNSREHCYISNTVKIVGVFDYYIYP